MLHFFISCPVLYYSMLYLGNSDIYFDESLYRLSNMSKPLNKQTVFALSKWFVHHEDTTVTPAKLPAVAPRLELPLRTDSQEAWIFNVPMSQTVTENSNFYIDGARGDNLLAAVLIEAHYTVQNPAFALRAIKADAGGRGLTLHDNAGVDDVDKGSKRWVFFSDDFA
jgi:hypothetical protein